jgi:hypothetical protein
MLIAIFASTILALMIMSIKPCVLVAIKIIKSLILFAFGASLDFARCLGKSSSVFSGVNQSQLLEFDVISIREEGLLGQLTSMVQFSHDKKSPFLSSRPGLLVATPGQKHAQFMSLLYHEPAYRATLWAI